MPQLGAVIQVQGELKALVVKFSVRNPSALIELPINTFLIGSKLGM